MSFLPGNQTTRLTSTTFVEIAGAPAAGVIRLVKEIIVLNADSINHTLVLRKTGTDIGTEEITKKDIVTDESGDVMDGIAVIVLDTTGQTLELATESAISATNPVVEVAYADFTPVDVSPFIVRWDTNIDFNKGAFVDTEVSGTGNPAFVQVAPLSDNDDDIDYVTPGDYTLSDGAKVEVSGGQARLKLLAGDSMDWPFTTSGNYTFDAGSIVVTGGVAKLVGTGIVDDLEGYWKMDEASWNGTPGEVTDSSLNTNDGTRIGNATTVAGGKIGRAGTFDGNDDSVAISHDSTLSFETTDPFSFQCWVKVGSGGNRSLMSKQQVSGSFGINMQVLTAGTIRMNLIGSTGPLAVDSTNTVDDDTYHHVVVTYDGSEVAAGIKTYIDGSLETPVVAVDTLSGSIVTSVDFRLGNRENSDQDYDGLLDEVGVWSRELTSGEVTSLYNANSGLALVYYPTDDPKIEVNTGLVFSVALDIFTETATKPGSDELQYQVSSDNGTTYKWWNGGAWVARTAVSVVTAVNTTVGTVDAGNLASLQTLDANTYDVSEIAANPGFTIEMDMSNVNEDGPDNVVIWGYYDGAHTNVDVDIWDFNTTSWVTLGQIATAGGSVVEQIFAVTGSKSDKVQSGVVNIRINHDEMGNASENIFLDYVYVDAPPLDEWWYDNESNLASVVDTNIGTLAASGTFKFIAFLHSVDGSTTPELNNITASGPATYSTTDNLYIDTKAASQIAPANIVAWLTALVTSTLPANTDAKILVSTDSRVNWQEYSGGSWNIEASPTLRANAMTFADFQTNFPTLALGSGTLDARIFVFTSVNSVRPLVSNINATSDAGFPASGTWESNEYDSTNIGQDWGEVNITKVVPGSSTVAIKARAGDVSGSLGAYGSALTDGDDAGVTGQYIQFFGTFTPDGVNNPQLDRVQCAYVTPIVTEVAP